MPRAAQFTLARAKRPGRSASEVAMAESSRDAGQRGPRHPPAASCTAKTVGEERRGKMRDLIMALCIFCMFLRRHGENIPGVSGCGCRSFSCFPSDACILSQAMCPVPRRGIHHRFNASETFTTNRLIRDALTFFIFGAPVGFFTRGDIDDGTVEPARAEKGKVVKFLHWLSQTLCPGVGNAAGAGLPSAISAWGLQGACVCGWVQAAPSPAASAK